MTDKSPGDQAAAGDLVNERLLQLLEQVVANQAVQASANLQDELAERLRAAVEYRDSENQTATPLGYAQLELGLRFTAVSNGLGRFGSHGERDVALLPAPLLDRGALSFAPLPATAATLLLFGPGGGQLATIDVTGGDALIVDGFPEVAWVQLNDRHGRPIRLGFPRRGRIARSAGAAHRHDPRSAGTRAT
jgi:hypothetical protein